MIRGARCRSGGACSPRRRSAFAPSSSSGATTRRTSDFASGCRAGRARAWLAKLRRSATIRRWKRALLNAKRRSRWRRARSPAIRTETTSMPRVPRASFRIAGQVCVCTTPQSRAAASALESQRMSPTSRRGKTGSPAAPASRSATRRRRSAARIRCTYSGSAPEPAPAALAAICDTASRRPAIATGAPEALRCGVVRRGRPPDAIDPVTM